MLQRHLAARRGSPTPAGASWHTSAAPLLLQLLRLLLAASTRLPVPAAFCGFGGPKGFPGRPPPPPPPKGSPPPLKSFRWPFLPPPPIAISSSWRLMQSSTVRFQNCTPSKPSKAARRTEFHGFSGENLEKALASKWNSRWRRSSVTAHSYRNSQSAPQTIHQWRGLQRAKFTKNFW